MNNYYKSGTWNAICDVCGFKFKMDKLKKRWDGLMVCHEDFELDHPQKYLRVRESGLAVQPVRPEVEPDQFVPVCYLSGISAYAGLAVAGCSIAGNTTFPPSTFT